MKKLFSIKSVVTMALLMLLLLSAFASTTMLVYAAKPIKVDNVLIGDNGSVTLTWKSGKSETYSSSTHAKLSGLDNVAIIPNHGYHILLLLINDIEEDIVDEDGFSLANVKNIKTISVTFLENNGVDDVDQGPNAESYPDPEVGLIFDYVEADAWASAYSSGLEFPGLVGEIWDIQTDAKGYEFVNVTLVFSLTELELLDPPINPYNLKIWITEVDILRSDLNLDGGIDGTDVSIVGNANPMERSDPNWNETLNLYPDDVIDDKDVNIVNNYNGESVWEQLVSDVWVDDVNDLVYVSGLTDHFSLFGGF